MRALNSSDQSGGLFPVPREQLVEPSSRMVGDAAQHVGEPGLGSDVVEFGRLNCTPF
jgi:hypothetical protein